MHQIEIQSALDNMTLLLDSREQKTAALQKRLNAIGLPYERTALKSGDYSCKTILPDGREWSLADKLAIERKMSADELASLYQQYSPSLLSCTYNPDPS